MAALTEEQSMIRDQAKSWVTEKAPVESFRKVRDSGNELSFDRPTWQAMIEMGWSGIIIPEAYGGSDLGYQTFGLVLEEAGRQLTASPLFASAYVGATALVLGGTEAQKQSYLPRVASGEEILSLALEEGPRHNPVNTALEARSENGSYVLSGSKTFVQEGMAATTFIVAARTSGAQGEKAGISLFLVPVDAKGVSRSRLHTVDSRGYANVEFNQVSVAAEAVLGSVDNSFDLLDAILDRASAGLAAEMLGTAAEAFEMTLTYLKTRVQFGQVIGSFQALGHRAADLFGAMELSRSCMEAALMAIDEGADDIAEMSSLSKCRVGDFLHEMSNQLIQIHGGIGMTDEFDAGFYLKRARVLETAFGNQAYHRDRFARLQGF